MSGLTKEVTATCGNTILVVGLSNIKYVHQLQHLLFGLGLNSEMEVQVMSVATQINHHCPFYGRKCYQCGYWNSRGNECEIITHQDRKI